MRINCMQTRKIQNWWDKCLKSHWYRWKQLNAKSLNLQAVKWIYEISSPEPPLWYYCDLSVYILCHTTPNRTSNTIQKEKIQSNIYGASIVAMLNINRDIAKRQWELSTILTSISNWQFFSILKNFFSKTFLQYYWTLMITLQKR